MRISNVFQLASMFMLAVTGSILLSGCSESIPSSTLNNNTLPTTYMHASTDINTDDPKQVVGFADYVFSAKVESITGTEYKFPVTIETEDGGTKQVTQPYTNYSIQVLDNIKGNLKQNISMPLQKSGGVSEEGNEYIVYDEDFLPEAGKIYIFNASAQPDGSLLVSGPHSNIEIKSNEEHNSVTVNVDDKSLLNQLQQTNEYAVYEDAYHNEIERDRKRFVAQYEQ